ncbi:F-type H+-transporting ATPase subunit gamma [Peptoclostridium litorale DSM 5388]|uniref:ATP synthase gamma chain n=1 Tax=Peptoclostridium litorale DSM 5388 TaxID=1121324 RepID=A0A069RCS0_PEPLI|nr:ATP synthase F1 subunit gamma [Peptoclostridium litorale]KDR94816.1 ATP synthase gamma chain [Peptoclostridium litorale DSM 5388]SIN93317.1 F-type H+-transporting ATPase subunit gamma [Peptoclostridium litorale DSM 5388]
MGVGMKDIKRRIKSVSNTKQITKAMELVSSAKLRRAKDAVVQSRPYFETLYDTIKEIAVGTKGIKNVYLEQRDVKNRCYIVLAGDRGLCGGYNSNALKAAVAHMDGKKEKVVTIGKKSGDFFSKRGYDVLESYTGISEKPEYSHGQDVAAKVMELYSKGEVDEVYLVYTYFASALVQEPRAVKLLPLSFESEDAPEDKKGKGVMNYEPSEEEVLNYLVPKFIGGIVYGGLVESSASEQGARRMAMESATGNAEDMIGKLDLLYNRARQASITQELSEIVAGASAI